jgi:hypothetical protein
MSQEQLVEPTLKTQLQLEAHEKECAMFRELVHGKLDALDKRMWRLEALIMASTIGVVALIITIVMKLG